MQDVHQRLLTAAREVVHLQLLAGVQCLVHGKKALVIDAGRDQRLGGIHAGHPSIPARGRRAPQALAPCALGLLEQRHPFAPLVQRQQGAQIAPRGQQHHRLDGRHARQRECIDIALPAPAERPLAVIAFRRKHRRQCLQVAFDRTLGDRVVRREAVRKLAGGDPLGCRRQHVQEGPLADQRSFRFLSQHPLRFFLKICGRTTAATTTPAPTPTPTPDKHRSAPCYRPRPADI